MSISAAYLLQALYQKLLGKSEVEFLEESDHGFRVALILSQEMGVSSNVLLGAALLHDKGIKQSQRLGQLAQGAMINELLDKWDQRPEATETFGIYGLGPGDPRVAKLWLANHLDRLRMAPARSQLKSIGLVEKMVACSRRLGYHGLQQELEVLLFGQMKESQVLLEKLPAQDDLALALERIGRKIADGLAQKGFPFVLDKRIKSAYSQTTNVLRLRPRGVL
jgi:(p)ppGpp synthase/HD superfamily hydrolase